MSGLRRRECRRCAAHPLIHGIAAADQGGHRCHRGGRSIPAVLRRQHRRHRHSFREASRIAQPYARDGGRPYCDRYPHARQATHSCRPGASRDGVERIRSVGIVPSALDAKTLPSNDEPINATIQEESTDKEAGAGDTPSPTNSAPASFEAPNEPAADPNDPELADSLGLADPQEIDEGNCCVLAALDHTEVIDAANIEVAAANQPVRKSAIIAFPESIEVVFLPSGEVVAPTLLTLLGAKNTRNEIKKVTVVDPATTAKLRLYAVAPDGGKTLEFDGDTLLAWRRLDIMQDVSYQIELEGFDRARDANIIAAAIESPQRLMTLRFDYYPYVPTTT